jgi:hypothetical protein
VQKSNLVSFIDKEAKKLQQQGTHAFKRRGRYFCPYHIHRPRDGNRQSLIQHAEALAKEDALVRVRGQHAALLRAMNRAAAP